MGRVVLYIAASLDGFIAAKDGSVAWLEPFEKSGEDYGYQAFLSRLGAIIMGGNTYRQVLEFGAWPYPGITSYVVTRRPLAHQPDDSIRSFSGKVSKLMQQVKGETKKDIWLVGGGNLITQFVNQSLVDEYMLFIIPVFLGEGIPLFQNLASPARLRLVEATTYPSGVVQLHYDLQRTL